MLYAMIGGWYLGLAIGAILVLPDQSYLKRGCALQLRTVD